MKTIEQAAKQLERSERGQLTCKLLRDFLRTETVQGLDYSNSEAVAALVINHMLGSGSDACAVAALLDGIVQRNQWVLK